MWLYNERLALSLSLQRTSICMWLYDQQLAPSRRKDNTHFYQSLLHRQILYTTHPPHFYSGVKRTKKTVSDVWVLLKCRHILVSLVKLTRGWVISTRKTSHELNNKDLSRLRQLSPGLRVTVYKVHKLHLRYMSNVSRFGLAVRRYAGKRKDLGSIPLRLSFLFKKVVVCGHCLVTLSITSYWNIKMALIAAHLNAAIILVVTA